MRSATSFFDKTLYRKSLSRFWPIWAVNLVVWLMIMPLRGLMALREDLENQTVNTLERFARNLGDMSDESGLMFAVVIGLLTAMAMFSHLYSSRSANFMAALPVRREGQFVSHYLAGLTALIAPNVLVFLLTLLVEAAGGQVYILPLLYWLGVLSVEYLFFYSFAVCLGQFTGHILALPVYYGVFNAIVVAFYFLLEEVMHSFYFGFAGFSLDVQEIVYLFTPVLVFEQMDFDCFYRDGVLVQQADGLEALLVYGVAAVVLTVIALLLYRKRHMETAGDVVAVRVMRPVFKYGVAACAGLSFGLVTGAVLGTGTPGVMAAIVLWAIVGYFVAQMLLDKSFRVFRHWKGAAAVSAAFLLLFAVISFDLTGYETRVPTAGDVVSVQISGLSGDGVHDDGNYINATLTDPAQVEKAVALHEAAVACRDDEARHLGKWGFTITYELRDGSTLKRRYSVADAPETEGQPGSIRYAVDQITADRGIMAQAYGFDRISAMEAQGARLRQVEYEAAGEYTEDRSIFNSEAARLLLEAVEKDFALGNIGRNSAGMAKENYEGMLYFSWSVPDGVEAAVTVWTEGEVMTEAYSYKATTGDTYTYSISISVNSRSVNTLAVLNSLLAEADK